MKQNKEKDPLELLNLCVSPKGKLYHHDPRLRRAPLPIPGPTPVQPGTFPKYTDG